MPGKIIKDLILNYENTSTSRNNDARKRTKHQIARGRCCINFREASRKKISRNSILTARVPSSFLTLFFRERARASEVVYCLQSQVAARRCSVEANGRMCDSTGRGSNMCFIMRGAGDGGSGKKEGSTWECEDMFSRLVCSTPRGRQVGGLP